MFFGRKPAPRFEYWYIYFDMYRDHQFAAVRTKNLVGWEDVSGRLELPVGLRHGTAFPAPQAVIEGLAK